MKKINSGPTSARDHLGMHAMPAFSRFQKVSNLENAIDLAKTLWDTTGWLWSDGNPGVDRRDRQLEAKAFDEDLFRRCPDLRLIRDLAEANKHGGELSRANVIVSGISGCGSPGGTLYTSTPFGMTEGTPKCTLQIDYEGGSRDMTETLTTAYKFLLAETS
jgi:hypothetical protein